MTDDFAYSRDWWCDLRTDLDQSHVAAKDSQGAILELTAAYGRIPTEQRPEVTAVLLEWVLSEDRDLRFDALAIVGEYRISEAVPVLRALRDRLEGESRTGAPYEWAKVNRILGQLAATDG